VKLPIIRHAWSGPEVAPGRGTISRRSILRVTGAAVGLAVVGTAASGVPGVRRLSVLATRTGTGPGGGPGT
jgi:hypothetical protein